MVKETVCNGSTSHNITFFRAAGNKLILARMIVKIRSAGKVLRKKNFFKWLFKITCLQQTFQKTGSPQHSPAVTKISIDMQKSIEQNLLV